MSKLQKGAKNLITDVPGVKVGHCTVAEGERQTGVTVVLPGAANPFTHKLTAASFVLNGFGKSQGLIQIDELGTLETPIALTNTLNVGLVHDALVQYMIDRCHAEGESPVRSINPIVCECNDAYLNDIQHRAVGYEQVMEAIHSASDSFALGAVGAGRGTICYGFKGGIGSASRVMEIGGETFTLGILVQSNYGSREDLRLENLKPIAPMEQQEDKGSIIMIIATDLPLSARQLKRVIKRASVGMARLGSYIGHGSGEIMVGFTTADPHGGEGAFHTQRILREDLMNIPFRAVGECCEEAIIRSMMEAETVTGFEGHRVESIREYLDAQAGF
ncbi:MAG: P1 family peptidase [Clostridia bacterium]|nr:P1 family peptidase [Clostridia bacterium]